MSTARKIFVLRVCHKRITFSPVKTLTVKLPELLFAEITHAAKERKIAKSVIVRERLERVSKEQPSLWSRMADLVIEEDALPTDLSSNKKHLQKYGKNRSHR